MRRLFLLLFLIPAYAFPATWGARGISRRFVVRGDLVFDVDGRGVAVYDVRDPAKIRRVDVAETVTESADAAFLGDDLYVATKDGFERFAVAPDGHLARTAAYPITPATRVASNGELIAASSASEVWVYRLTENGLTPTGTWPSANRVTAIAWRQNALLVAVDSVGVVVLDGSTLARTGYIGENAVDLALDGNLLYTASGHGGVAIYDITDLAAARLLSRSVPSEEYFQLVAVDAGRVVAAEVPSKVRFFDVSSPEAPRAFPAVAERVQAMALSGTRLFVSGSTFDQFGVETASGVPLRVLEITDPNAPRLLGEVADLAGPLTGVATDGTLAYVSDPPFFRVIDVSTTETPREMASLRIDGIEPLAKVLGTRVILYGTGDVQSIDVSDPYHPRLTGKFASLGRPPSGAAIVRSGFVEGNPWSGFHVFNFFPDGSTNFLSGIKIHPVDIVANGGDAVYYIVEFQSVAVTDVSGTAHLVKAIPIRAIQLAMANATDSHPDLLLVRDTTAIHLFSLAAPFDPVALSTTALQQGGGITADGNAAYVAGNGDVLVIDITDPAAPAARASGMRVVAPSQVAAANGKVLVADRYALRVYGANTAAPAPRPLGRRRAARP